MKAIIISGAPHAWLDLTKLNNSDLIIGVDRGAIILLNSGIIPAVAIGDFDSISDAEFDDLAKSGAQIIKLDSHKDETDTEVAILHAISLSIDHIEIYGALGGRIDHTIANIRLLLKFVKEGINIQLKDKTNSLRVLSPGTYEFEPIKSSYLSFFALEEAVENLTLTGVKYPLNKYLLCQDDIRCTSNEVTATTFGVAFSQGFLLMIQSRD